MLIAGCRTLERRNFVLLSPVAGGELCCTLPPHKRRKRHFRRDGATSCRSSLTLLLPPLPQPDPSFGASDRFDSNKRKERERLLFPSSSPNFWRQRLSGDSGKSTPLPPKSSAASGAKVCEVNTFDIAFCFSSSPLPPPLLSPPPLC